MTRALKSLPIEVPEVAEPAELAIHKEMVRAHGFFVRRFWGASLAPALVMTEQPAPPNAREPVTYRGTISSLNPTVFRRVTVYPVLVAVQGIDLALTSMLRATVHHWQHTRGDPSTRIEQPNAEWRAEAERVGLIVEGRGGAVSPGPEAQLAFTALGSTLVLPQVEIDRPAQKSHVWTCRCTPAFRIRVSRAGFAAVCSHCHKPFKPE